MATADVVNQLMYYRLYFLQNGSIKRFVDFDIESDDEALAEVRKHRDGNAMELWQEHRLVKRFPPAPVSNGSPKT